MHLTVRFSGLEKPNAAFVSVTDESCELYLPQISLYLATKTSCAKGQPSHFYIRSSKGNPIRCRLALCAEWKLSGTNKGTRDKSGFQKMTSRVRNHTIYLPVVVFL